MDIKKQEQLEKEIQDLKDLVSMEKQVKANEVIINRDLKKHIINLEITIETLQKINDTFLEKITELKQIIRDKL